MKYIYLTLCFLVVGSINVNSQVIKKKKKVEQIQIMTTFEPTLELTDEIRNTSLKDLIIKGKGNLSDSDKRKKELYDEECRQLIKKDRDEYAEKLRLEGYSKKEIQEKLEHYISYYAFKSPTVSPTDFIGEFRTKSVPETSNLAKVYYLQDMGNFIKLNQEYYDKIIREYRRAKLPHPEEYRNWDKYE